MNNTASTTVGIDTVIKSLQEDLYKEIDCSWKGTIQGFGRVYRNMTSHGTFRPSWFLGDKDYTDVYYNDNYACVFCFIDSENHKTEDGFVYNADVRVVFMVDLKRILPGESDRGDMDAQYDVINILRNYSFGRYDIKGIVKGLKNVFQGFDTTNIKFSDMQPYHCFGVDLKLNYEITDKCT